MDADLTRVVALQGRVDETGQERALSLNDLDVIEAAVIRDHPALIVVDPIIAYVANKDANKAHEVRSLLAPLAALAEKHGVAIIVIQHLNKSAVKASYRGQGSIDFLAACRSAFLVGEDPQDSSRKVMCHVKSNLSQKSVSLTYTINQGQFLWGEESPLTAEQVLAVPVEPGEKNKLSEAQKVLQDLLSNGPVSSVEAEKEAKKAGVTPSTLKRARSSLGITAKKASFAGGWIWSMPNGRSSCRDDDLVRENVIDASGKSDEKSTKRIILPEEDHPNRIRDDDPLRDRDPWD
jgi:DNA repair protein RadA/Sms